MYKIKLIPFLLYTTILFSSCAKTPIQKYITSNKYEPFTIPRSDWGTGTVINFKGGTEEIVALNRQCINLVPDSSNVELSNYSYTLKRDNAIELSLAKVLNSQLDLKGAFNNARVKKVIIRVIRAKEKVLPVISVKERITKLDQEHKSDCLNEILVEPNIIIMRTLSVDSLVYTFLDDKNTAITLDAAFMQDINANAEIKSTFEGKTELNIHQPTYIGYRAREFRAGSGLVDGEIVNKEITGSELKKRKESSR